MPSSHIKKNAQTLLALARKIAEQPGITWVDANNAIYAPGGAFAQLFPTMSDRKAFDETEECQQLDEVIDRLPDAPARPDPRAHNDDFLIRVPDCSPVDRVDPDDQVD